MGLQAYYDNVCRTNVWAHADKNHCGCGGSGWWLSDLDTRHTCPYHYRGQPSPDDSEEEWAVYEAKEDKRWARYEDKGSEAIGDMHEKNLPSDELDEIPF